MWILELMLIIAVLMLHFIWAGCFSFALNRVSNHQPTSRILPIYFLSLLSFVLLVPGIWASIFNMLFDLRWSARYVRVLLPLSVTSFFILAWFYGVAIKTSEQSPIGTRKGLYVMLILLLLSIPLFVPAFIMLVMVAGF